MPMFPLRVAAGLATALAAAAIAAVPQPARAVGLGTLQINTADESMEMFQR